MRTTGPASQPTTASVPTVLRAGPYRVYFWSHEPNEAPHVHVDRDDHSAKYWLSPVRLAQNLGYAPHELTRLQHLIRRHERELLRAWNDHFRT